MELQNYLRVVRRYWRSVVATILVCVAAVAGFTLLQSPRYSATATLYVAVSSGDSAGELSQGATYTERQVQSFAQVATSASVLEPVIDELGLETTTGSLKSRLSVTTPTATSIIKVNATAGGAGEAADVANAVSESLARAIDELAPRGPNAEPLVQASLIDPAKAPGAPSSPRPVMNLALAGILGVLLAMAQAILRDALDTRVRGEEDLEQISDAPILGRVSTVSSRDDQVESWSAGESYRRLRTNVGFTGLGGERKPSIVVTSAGAGEGKTETSTNLARVLAEAGERTLLVDADLRRPQVAQRLSIDGDLGLSDVLTNRVALEEVLAEMHDGNLHVLPAGTIPPNPSELLGSERMADFIAWAEKTYRHVIFDTPPVLPVTDSVVLGAQTGGAIVVARHGRVRKHDLDAAVDLLDAGSAALLGFVLNDVPVSKQSTYAYYYNESASKATDSRGRGRSTRRDQRALDQDTAQGHPVAAAHARRG